MSRVEETEGTALPADRRPEDAVAPTAETNGAARSAARHHEDDDFWEWFDAPVEVPDRGRLRIVRVAAPRERQSLGRIVLGVAAWAVVVGCFLIVAVLVLPRLFGMQVREVDSGSMAPAIATGDAVLIQPILVADFKAGDVIAYRPPENPSVLVIHRIESIRFEQVSSSGGPGEYVITTKGDANRSLDQPFRAAPGTPFGKVIYTFPKLGYLLNFLSGPRGKLLAIVAFVAFVVAGSVSRRRARQIAGAEEAPA